MQVWCLDRGQAREGGWGVSGRRRTWCWECVGGGGVSCTTEATLYAVASWESQINKRLSTRRPPYCQSRLYVLSVYPFRRRTAHLAPQTYTGIGIAGSYAIVRGPSAIPIPSRSPEC